jgi:hypothetical protein
VDVIGHEEKNVREPNESVMAELDGIEQRASDFRIGQLSQPPLLAVDCNKIDFILWVNPKWHVVR